MMIQIIYRKKNKMQIKAENNKIILKYRIQS